MTDKRPIGIFDSGIGGLTVLRQLQNFLPQEDFIYFADTAHLPYGDKTPEQIIDYARRTLIWMQEEAGAKLVVAACHTSSALALETVSPEFAIPVIGMIYPLLETLLQNPGYSRIGILATPASVKSRMHERILLQAGFEGAVESISCPDFVPLIEDGHLSGASIETAAKAYLRPFQAQNLNTLVYGCTHYPLIAQTIHSLLPATVHCIDPAERVAAKAAQELYKQKMLNLSSIQGSTKFYCSSAPQTLASHIRCLKGIPHPEVTLKSLASLMPAPQRRVVNE